MIKICHMTSAHKSTDTRIFYKQCVSLARAGYDVYLVAQGESFELNGVKVTGVPKIIGGRLKRMTHGVRSIYNKAVEINADIYQIHDPELLPYALKLKKKGKIVIFDSHEDFIGTLLEKPYIPLICRPIAYYIFKIYYSIVIKKYDAIITVTPHIYENLKKINKNVYIVANYPIKDDEFKIYTRSKKIIFAGGINSQWSHHLIIKALEQCDNAKYLLLGSINEKYINELKKLPQWKSVELLGMIPHKDVSTKLKEASIGMAVVAYNRNTNGAIGTLGNTKIFEYMAEALPVICTDFILWKKIIEKYTCGICVNPYDIDEIASAINYLLNNPKIAEKMGQNGRRAICEEFNWSIEEKKLIELYKGLI